MNVDRASMVTRRRFLRNSGIVLGGAYLDVRRLFSAALRAEIIDLRVISRSPDLYHGWPTLTRRRDGQLLLVYSGGRESHVCPFGRVELMQSTDNGEHWTWPRVLLDGAIDDRDAGILETAKGTLLVTTFSSLAYEDSLKAALSKKQGTPGAWDEKRLAAWHAVNDRLSPAHRKAELNQWMLRSEDGGISWFKPYPSTVNSPHGPFEISDGRLLYAGKELWTGQRRVGVCQSADDGKSWAWLANIPTRDGDDAANYHELHGVEAPSGRLVVHIRNHNSPNQGETLQSESSDGGRTWSVPHSIVVWGLPSFLLRLRDGRLLMTYGHRRPPFGNQARISSDEGVSWSPAMVVSSDGASGDLGYPSTVELGDGTLVTVWYEKLEGNPHAVLRQAHWGIRE